MTDKRIELAERCERAAGPDREIDMEIYRSLDHAIEQSWPHWNKEQQDMVTPEYTTSLDAALTLVPEGHDIKITQASGPGRSDWYGNCKLRNDWGDGICHKGNAASGALALCASALRARAAMNAEEQP
jgi:hypothetical protein